jgi:hypothetical protein
LNNIYTGRQKIISFILFFSFIIFFYYTFCSLSTFIFLFTYLLLFFCHNLPVFTPLSPLLLLHNHLFFSVSCFLSSFSFSLLVLFPLDIYYFVVFPIPCVFYFTSLSYLIGFEVLIAVVTRSSLFRDIMLCSPLKVN